MLPHTYTLVVQHFICYTVSQMGWNTQPINLYSTQKPLIPWTTVDFTYWYLELYVDTSPDNMLFNVNQSFAIFTGWVDTDILSWQMSLAPQLISIIFLTLLSQRPVPSWVWVASACSTTLASTWCLLHMGTWRSLWHQPHWLGLIFWSRSKRISHITL